MKKDIFWDNSCLAGEFIAFNVSISCPGMVSKRANFQWALFLHRFSVNGTKYRGYSYSYNPCGAVHLGPNNSGCQGNVAVSH